MKEFLPQLTPWAGAVMALLHPVATAAAAAGAGATAQREPGCE